MAVIGQDTGAETARRRHAVGRYLLAAGLYIAAYLLLDRATPLFTVAAGQIMWYLPPALTLALLVAGGPRYTPAVALALAVASVLDHHAPLYLAIVVPTLGYAVASLALRRGARIAPRLRRVRDVVWFAAIAVFAAPFAIAMLLEIAGRGAPPTAPYWPRVYTEWLAAAIGIAVLAPFLLVHVAPALEPLAAKLAARRWDARVLRRHRQGAALLARRRWDARAAGVTAAQAVAVLLGPWVIFRLPVDRPFHRLYLCFLPLIWVALRRGLPGTTAATLALSAVLLPVLHDYGRGTAFLSDAQLFVLVLALTGLVLGALTSERGDTEESLRHQALHDALTALPNRALLYDRVQQALESRRRDQAPVALLLIDLDRFKDINDTLGHHYGDLLLRQFGARVRAGLRAGDTVARLGGDEFAVLLPGADVDAAVSVAGKVTALFEQPFSLAGAHAQHLFIAGSIGIALAVDEEMDGAMLLRQADVAMYIAKREGRDYAIYDTAQDQHSLARLALERHLRQAMAREQFLLHYQPKVDLATGRVSGVEALLRWRHPQQGLVPPDRFIPLSEEVGLIKPLTAWVLREALRQCRAWRDEGLHLSVAVNLSMSNLHDPALPATVAGLLNQFGVPASCLRIEVTESTIMTDAERTLEVLTRLVALGVSVSVDDFGTGYSSLSYLKRLPVDELKIDRSFVRHMSDDAADTTIVTSIIGLGHNLGLRVVAEGIEDKETWSRLSDLGCDVAQGYYLSRPCPAADLERWLRKEAWATA